MTLRHGLALLLCLSAGIAASAARGADAAASPRERLLLDFGWKFTHGDPADAGNTFDYSEGGRLDKVTADQIKQENERATTRPSPAATNLGSTVSYVQPVFDDSAWRPLNLPHDWVMELGIDRRAKINVDSPTRDRFHNSHGFRDIDASKGTNIGWYRRQFDLPATDAGKTLRVEFDGVFRNSVVWINGQCLGRYPSGYTSFSYDITKFAKPGAKNTLVVRVDASRFEGWFYEGAGIYRHVWLVKTDPVHVPKWGSFVTTEVKGDETAVTIQTQLANRGERDETVALVTTLIDADGKAVGTIRTEGIALKAGAASQEVSQRVTINNARLWSPETPMLYRAVSEITKAGGKTADVYETSFGVRTLQWDANHGFLLNGKRYQIKGTCNHQNHAGVGTAMPDRLVDYRIGLLKEMGSNAYRCAHYPPSPEVLDACDRLGLLVMNENRRMDTTAWAIEQLESMVRRDRNHPSVFIWCLGNEEMQVQGRELGATIVKQLQAIVQKLDPTRLCTVGMNGGWGTGITTAVQVQGYNYMKNGDIDATRAAFPNLPHIGTEEASTLMTRGEYANGRGFQSAYDKNLPKWGSTAEAWLQYFDKRPFLAGSFVWTGFDYRGEPTPFGWPNTSSQFGILDLCGFPKDAYYLYRAWWRDEPLLHVFPHWNWPGKEGQPIDVWAYSNCDEVELLLNGKSLGRQKMPRMGHLEWKVNYEPGILLARGYKDSREALSDQVETTGEAVALKLTPDRSSLNADGEDVSMVAVSAIDAQGRPVPVAKHPVRFSIKGGRNVGVGNGDPTSHESDKADARKLFNGLAQVIVQTTRTPGTIEVTATADGLAPATVNLTARSAPPRPAVP